VIEDALHEPEDGPLDLLAEFGGDLALVVR
jgi:hypothetical protein